MRGVPNRTARNARDLFHERENLFRDRYEGKWDENQVRAIAMHPKTALELAEQYGQDVFAHGQPSEIEGYRVVRSFLIPIGEIRIVPKGRLEFVREGPSIYAWPHPRPDGRDVRLTLIEQSGTLTCGPEVHRKARERLESTPIGRHPSMGTPDVYCRKVDEGTYRLRAQFPYRDPKGRKAQKTAMASAEMLQEEAFITTIVSAFFLAPAPEVSPNFARTDLVTTDR